MRDLRTAMLGAAVLCAIVPATARSQMRFTDATKDSGLFVAENTGVGGTNPHAVAIEDFDGDGRFDVILPTFGAPHIRYFRNLGGLKFADVTKGSGLETFEGAGTGAAVADFDRDGRLDVYLTSLRKGASRLFRGRGDGTFEDASETTGTLVADPARSCAWSDVDGDGWVDLYVTRPDGPNLLFRNLKNGKFENVAARAGVELADRHSLGCAFGDVDGDGRDDLFVTNYRSQSSTLFRNLGDFRFEDVTERAGVGRKASAVGCVFGDVRNLGRLDLLVTTDSWLSGANSTEEQLLKQGHTVEPNLLLLGDGRGSFVPSPEAVLRHKTLSHDAVLEDLDHDGFVEIYVGVDAIPTGNRFATSKGGNPLWTRAKDGAWSEVAAAWGTKFEANCVCVPAADFDDDGDLDLLLVNFYDNVVLYRNETNGDGWLRIEAVGTKSNPDGIGAKIAVFDEAGRGDRLLATRHVQSGEGYCRSSPLSAHVGLGRLEGKTCRVEVAFPGSGTRTVRPGIRPGTKLVVKESE